MTLNLCFVALYDVLNPAYGGGSRVSGLLNGLRKATDVNRIILIYPFADMHRRAGVSAYDYPSHRDFGALRPISNINILDEINPFRASSLIRLARKCDVDIIQNEGIWGWMSPAAVARNFGIPFVIDEHNFEAQYVKEVRRGRGIQLYVPWLESNSLRSADHVLMVSEEDKRKALASYGIEADKVSVIPNGVDTSEFHPVGVEARRRAKSKLGLDDKFVLVFHGSLDYGPNRDAITMINDFIIRRLAGHIPNASFLIIGRNPPIMPHDESSLRFTGFVPDLYEYLAAADAAVVPILRGGGTKTKLLEYLAMGLPIVTTRKAIEGLDIVNGRHALISANVDEDFVENIIQIHGDDGLRERLSSNARDLAKSYDWGRISMALVEVYNRLLT